MNWNLDEIIKDTKYLHVEMGWLLDRYISGSEAHGKVYGMALDRMKEQGHYKPQTIAFYEHLYNGAKQVIYFKDVLEERFSGEHVWKEK